MSNIVNETDEPSLGGTACNDGLNKIKLSNGNLKKMYDSKLKFAINE